VVAVGRDVGRARRQIDVSGLAVAPGFIDPHSHSDVVPFLAEPQPFKLLQGVTTEINGNCGFSVAPLDAARGREAAATLSGLMGNLPIEAWSFSEYLNAMAAAGPTNHLATLVGHSTLRMAVNGYERGLAGDALDQMRQLAYRAFADGAIGLSTGLIYPPGAYGDVDEIVALATVAHHHGRPYATHMRDEGAGLEQALDEAAEIATRARVRLQISHCKAAGRSNHGKSELLLRKLHAARITGVDVRGDAYPYLAGGTAMSALVPPEALENDPALEGLSDPAERGRLRSIAEDAARTTGTGLWRDTVPQAVCIMKHTRSDIVGRTLADVASDRDPWDVACELIRTDPSSQIVITMMAEDDVRRILADPLIGIGSDNGVPTGLEHPRTWGCFPHFLGRYVRECESWTGRRRFAR